MNLARTSYSTDRWLDPVKSSNLLGWDEENGMPSMQALLNSIVRPIRSVVLFRVAREQAIAEGHFISCFPYTPVSPLSLLRMGSSSPSPSVPVSREVLPLTHRATSANSVDSSKSKTRPSSNSVIEYYTEMNKDGMPEPHRRKSTKSSHKGAAEESAAKPDGKKGKSKKTVEPPAQVDVPEKSRSAKEGSSKGRNSGAYLEEKTINGCGPYLYERQYVDGVYKSRYKGKEGKGTQSRQRNQSPKPTCPSCGSNQTVSNGTDKQRGKRCYKCTFCLHRWRMPLEDLTN